MDQTTDPHTVLNSCEVHAESLNCGMQWPDCEGWTVRTELPEGKTFEQSGVVTVRWTHRVRVH